MEEKKTFRCLRKTFRRVKLKLGVAEYRGATSEGCLGGWLPAWGCPRPISGAFVDFWCYRGVRVSFFSSPNRGGWFFTPQRAFEGASFQHRRHAHSRVYSWASFWAKCAATIPPPALTMHSVLLRNERLQNEHNKSAGASSSSAVAGKSHSSQRVLKFSKINGIHYHYSFGESRRFASISAGNCLTRRSLGFCKKPRRARIPL